MSHYHRIRSAQPACLVDGDNLTCGGQVLLDEATEVLHRIADLSHGMPVTFAMQRRLAVDYMPAFVGLGWGVRFASMAPDAADFELLEAADDYVSHGVCSLVVASGDHAFAGLARHARLYVLTFRSSLSKRLQMAATHVTYLDDLLGHPTAA